MKKIKVITPIVELDGDEMARVMWAWIKDLLILPYVDIDLVYFDYHLKNRDATENRILFDAAEAIKKYRVGVKCAAINPDQKRVEEYGLKKAWKSPNSGTRNQIGGTLFRQPIVFDNIPRLIPGWKKPIVVARHAFGGMYGGTDMSIPDEGKVTLNYIPAGKGASEQVEIYEFKGP
ncbi:MAG: NADP-dependent isocitrate dehydrogenase, partial [Desulfobacterales bacterium]|nr:NADP-dependent isocitrate dehydrogenase [Deltaproteobacteria bacterium]NNK94659.1 NADP-dependent isocitrate dehydrogenase [Desulfobacterales bacterium]